MRVSDIARHRLLNQQLTVTKLRSAAEMVGWFGAVQGQEYAQTKWGLGIRLPHLSDSDIEAELSEGRILRTHLLRPTWHFVSAADIHWLLLLTAPRVQKANAYMYRKLELDQKIFTRCNDILFKILTGNVHLTRDQVNDAFKKQRIKAEGHRLGYIMMNAELEGIVCSGVRQGNQFTYALLDERAPHRNVPSKDEALASLTKRYFQSRNPATLKDYATWSGLTTADCRKGIEMIGPFIKEKTAEQKEYYVHGNIATIMKKENRIRLLPIYDEYIMGYKDRTAIMVPERHVSFQYDCMIISDGMVIGTWKRTITKKYADLCYAPFKPLSQTEKKSLDEEIIRLGEFLRLPVNVRMHSGQY